MDTLRTNAPHALVYIDAGNAAWIKDLPALAAALRASGVGHAGFALNVSNFVPTKASIVTPPGCLSSSAARTLSSTPAATATGPHH